MNFPSSRQHVERKTKIFIIHTSKSVHAHTLRPTHTHLSDIRSLYCPLKFSGSQISIDERISIKHVWDAARNRELWTSYLHRSLCPSNPSFFSLLLHQHYPSASLSQSRSPQWFSRSLPFSPLSPSLSLLPVWVAFGKLANCVLLTWVHVLSGDQLFV